MNYKRVNKPIARNMYNKGCNILLLPCKVSDSVVTGVPHDFDWIKAVEISEKTCTEEMNKFDRSVNSYEYYNCNAELGYYSHYFVSEDDYNKFKTGGNSDGVEESKESSKS